MGAIAWKGSRVQTQFPQDGRCRHMAQSRPASTESVPVDQMLMPWPKRPCPCSLLPASTSPRALFNCHGRCKTRANHHRQRPLCITQPRQDRRAAYATTSLRGLFLTLQALSLCRLGHGRREWWPDGLNCRHLSSSRCQPARWLVSCCFLVFLAPSVSSPASSLRDAPMKPAGGGGASCPAHSHPPFLSARHHTHHLLCSSTTLPSCLEAGHRISTRWPTRGNLCSWSGQHNKGDEAITEDNACHPNPQCRGTSGRPVTGPGRGHTTGGGKSSPWTHVPCDPARLFCALAGAPA